MTTGSDSIASGVCRRCGAPIDGRPWLYIWGTTLLTLGFLPHNPGPLCAGCKDAYNFSGLLMLLAVLVIAFVLVVGWLA